MKSIKLHVIVLCSIFLCFLLFNVSNLNAQITNRALTVANTRLSDIYQPAVTKSQSLFSRQETISGTVKNASNGNVLAGVNILVKGTNNGTYTDKNGQYSLSVASLQDTLMISYVGFKSKIIPIQGRRTINITLKESQQALNQMVVIGYGTQKRSDLTSSIAKVDVDEALGSRSITSVGEALQGKVAGLTVQNSSGQIGQQANITLRGLHGSVNGTGSHPLILVDGVEVPSLEDVNPHDVKSISVLKDAASTAIYGNRAAFGAILIKTKEGTKGEEPQVSYHGNFSVQTPTKLPTVSSAADGAEYAFKALQRTEPNKNTYTVLGMSVNEETIKKMREWQKKYGNMNLGPTMVEGRDFELKNGKQYFYRSWDALDLLTKKWAPQMKHNLSVSGGSDVTSYRIGLGYLRQQGAIDVVDDKYKRYNVNLAVNSTVNDWLDVGGRAKYSLRKRVMPYTQHSSTYNIWYYATRWPKFYPYGTYEGHGFRNVLTEINQANPTNNTYGYFRTSVNATAHLLSGLDLDGKATYGRRNYHLHQTGGEIRGINFWTGSFNYETYTPDSFNEVDYSTYWKKRLNMQATLTYKKTVAEHSFKILGGVQPEWYENWNVNAAKRGLLDKSKGEFDLANGNQYVSGSHNHNATMGFFGRINYSFEDKYLLQLNGRYTGSSNFPPNERWGFFPSGSVGWKVSEEPFMNFAKPILSFLKVRSSYGSVGHNVYGYPYLATLSSYTSSWLIGDKTGKTTFTTPQPVSSSLSWETVNTLDIGGDAKFFDNQLDLTFDWYKRLTKDMITPGLSVPATFGTSTPKRNYGELQSKGFDLTVGWNHSFNKNFTLNLKGTLSNYNEEITKFASKYNQIPSSFTQYNINYSGHSASAFYEGEDPNDIWGYVTDRLFTDSDFKHNPDGSLMKKADGGYVLKDGIPDQSYFESGSFHYGPGDVKYKDLNGDGKITPGENTIDSPGDQKVIGNSTPNFQYGFTLAGNWKDIDFNIFFQGVGSREFWADGPLVNPGYAVTSAVYDYQMDYWSPKGAKDGGGPDAFYPRPTSNTSGSRNYLPQSRYLLNMAYLRLKDVRIGYTLPSNLLSNIHIRKLRIYVDAANILTFDHLKPAIDPETSYTNYGLNNINTFGRQYPFHKTISLGIDLKL